MDPKLAWALKHRERFPVDVNRADRELLLRIPGLGSRGVQRVIQARRHHALRVVDLKRVSRSVKRMLPFVVLADWSPSASLDGAHLREHFVQRTAQMDLFPTSSRDRVVSELIAVELAHAADHAGWRAAARRHLAEGTKPERLVWHSASATADLFGQPADAPIDDPPPASAVPPMSVSRHFLDLVRRVVCHRDTDRFALLYRLLWRRAHGEPELLRNPCDPDVHRAEVLGKAVGRDMHKMRAFVRFRRSTCLSGEHYHAWFEPDHHILRFNAEFFLRRFAAMHWSIATPDGCAHWNGTQLQFGPALRRDELPAAEPMEALWQTYFANIFNPARLRLDAMRSEMPMKYWKHLPEAPLIAPLTQQSQVRTQTMVEATPTTAPRFAGKALHVIEQRAAVSALADTLPELATAVRQCERCEHACRATQAVPGQGSATSRIMLVGEQPGDREDLQGTPFVGPAGLLLRELLIELGSDPQTHYLTNAVKHFRYSVRGKLRLHQRPTEQDLASCQPWLAREIELVNPKTVIALGASAARSLLGRSVRVQAERGQWIDIDAGRRVLVTLHPASILRQRTPAGRDAARAALRSDLRLAIESGTDASAQDAAAAATD